MTTKKNEKEFIEWGKNPKPGMKLIGFSAEAVLDGREIKDKIFELLKEGELGFRKAVNLLRKEALCSFDQAVDIITRIKKDTKSKAYSKKYKYTLNRVFWSYEKHLPKNDPRYFVLNVLDCSESLEKNENIIDDLQTFINNNISKEDLEKNKKFKKGFEVQEVESKN